MYLDPGFGGMLAQVLVAIAAAGGIILFSLRRKLRALFSKNKEADFGKTNDDEDAAGASTDATESGDDDVIDMLSDDKTADE